MKRAFKCLKWFKIITYLHQSVGAGTHECVHYTIKGIIMRIPSHVTNSFTCREVKADDLLFMMTGTKLMVYF